MSIFFQYVWRGSYLVCKVGEKEKPLYIFFIIFSEQSQEMFLINSHLPGN